MKELWDAYWDLSIACMVSPYYWTFVFFNFVFTITVLTVFWRLKKENILCAINKAAMWFIGWNARRSLKKA